MESPAAERPPRPVDADSRVPAAWEADPWWRQALGSVDSGPTMLVVGAGAVAVVVVAALVLWPRQTASIDDAVPHVGDVVVASPVTSAEVQVHVAGAVANPGVYRLPAGGRVADVVEAAGGLTTDAEPDRVNLAAELRDGSQVFVPRIGEDVPTEATSAGAAEGGGPGAEATIDVNTAGVADLERLPGIGPSLAEAIVRHRETHGPFATLDDLTAVSGIGPAKLEALRDSARV